MIYLIVTIPFILNLGIFLYYLKKISSRISSLESDQVDRLFLNDERIKEIEFKAKSSSPIPEITENIILSNLQVFEQRNNFTDKNMSLAILAKHLKTNSKYLSYIINKHKGTNYSIYINELRVNYIVKKFEENPEYIQYNASKLAEEAGFISRTAFATIFKNVTGKSPSQFKSELKGR